MAEIATCPKCRQRLQVPPELEDRAIRCPYCGTQFRHEVLTVEAVEPATPDPMTGELRQTVKEKAIPLEPVEEEPIRRKLLKKSYADDDDDNDDDFASPGRREDYSGSLPGKGRYIATLTLLIFWLIAGALGLAVSLLVFLLAVQLVNGNLNAQDNLGLADGLQFLSAVLHYLIIIPAIIVFLTWFYRVHANLRILNAARTEYTSGWAVGYFFVPFLNLVRPVQVGQEIWKGSDPDYAGDRYGWRHAPSSFLVTAWWLMWIFTSIAMRISMAMEPPNANPPAQAVYNSALCELFAESFLFVAGILVTLMVWKIWKRQEAKFQILQEIENRFNQ